MKKIFKILLILFILVMIFMPYLAPALSSLLAGWGLPSLATIVAGMAGISPWLMGAAAIGLSYLVAPTLTTEVLTDFGKGIATVASVAGETIGSVIGGVASGLSGVIVPLALIVGGWFLFGRKSDADKDREAAREARVQELELTKARAVQAASP